MTRPRRQQISLEATPFYHVVSRCVRRAFLCGQNDLTGRSYEHRRQQIQEDLLSLASIFCIDVLAFSIMHNHFHVLLHVNRDKGLAATGISIVKRLHKHFSGNEISQKFVKRGSIATDTPPIIQRLNISPDHWIQLCTHFESRFKGLVGSAHSLKTFCREFGLHRRSNLENSKLLFG